MKMQPQEKSSFCGRVYVYIYHDMSSICLLYEKKKTMPLYAFRRITGVKGI